MTQKILNERVWNMDYILEIENLSKEFPGVKALDNVSMNLKPGEILALCGENGAGKSTLIKVLSGIYPYGSYGGEVRYKGQTAKLNNVKDAETLGISTIFQEIELIKDLSVRENLFLGVLPTRFGFVKWDQVMSEATESMRRVGLDIDSEAIIRDLSVAQQQMIEIAKALFKKSEVLILDEPTSALTENEISRLFEILNNLRRNGISCIYISHKLDEVYEIADRVTVIRDGRHIATRDIKDVKKSELISMMVGREMTDFYPKIDLEKKEVALEVKNYSVWDSSNKKLVDDVSFNVHRGEIVGFAGLVGSGRTELMTAIFGAHKWKYTGETYLDGKRLRIRNTQQAINHGISYVSEDRKAFGLVLPMSVEQNITLSSLRKMGRPLLNKTKEITSAKEYMVKMDVKAPSLETKAGALSGGNQQKLVLAKWMLTLPKVLILDEPTRGIDVAVKYEIYTIINKLAEMGKVIVVVSSEMQEIIGICSRILVMREGKITGEFDNTNRISQEEVVKCCTGNEE